MSILSFLPIIGKVVEKGLNIVDSIVEDKDKANEIKAAIKQQIMEQSHDELTQELEARMQIILAEAKGGWLQRNWRPILMLTIIAIVANNYVLFPYLSAFTDKVTILELPSGLWALLNVGVGGYILGRSGEKIIKTFKGDKQ